MFNKLLLSGLLIAVSVSAKPSPIARSYRALAMGGASVAVVDDRDAVHYNPAGLSLLGHKGTHGPLDSINYWREKIELQWDPFGFDIPVGLASDFLDYQSKYGKYYQTQNVDTLLNHQEIFDGLYAFDRRPIPVNWNGEANWAIRNYGASAWGEIEPRIQIDHGALLPILGLSLKTVQAVEVATSRSFFQDRLSLGVGYRVAIVSEESVELPIEVLDKVQDTAIQIGMRTFRNISRTQDYGHGLDLGVLWFQRADLRFGGAVQNLGMKMKSEWLTPNLSMGVDWSPKPFQRNDKWGRKINFAASLDRLLDSDNGYKPLSKINFGGEWTQTLVPYVLSGRLSGGFKGGYPTFGFQGELFRFFQMEGVTYAEETGAYTGHLPVRYWLIKFGAGF